MNKDAILYGIIGLLLGIVVTGYSASNAVNSGNAGVMQMMGIRSNTAQSLSQKTHMMKNGEMMGDMMEDDDSMSMDGMVRALKGKKGDAFDKEFLSLMIEHHQGAIDMAKAAQLNSSHQELKDLAEAIIAAQTKEIEDMKSWQVDWGYSK